MDGIKKRKNGFSIHNHHGVKTGKITLKKSSQKEVILDHKVEKEGNVEVEKKEGFIGLLFVMNEV